MPDEKISQLDAVTDVLDDDDYVLARAGSSKRITGASLKADLSGSSSLIDLGVITVTALIAGAQTLRTPAAGSALWLFPVRAGFVATDGAVDIAPSSRIAVDHVAGPMFQWSPGGTFDVAAFNLPAAVFQGTAIQDGTAVKAVLQTNLNAYSIVSAAPAWQANHAYAASVTVIRGPDDHYWSQSAGGLSGGSIPDFAGNEGGTVADNTVTWTDEGALPTVGTLHLYAMTMAAP